MIAIPTPRIDTGPFVFGDSRGDKVSISFETFISRVNPRYRLYPYLEQLAGLLQRVADDELTRLMIFAPPRHGKSELVSRLFAAYYLYRHPARWIGLTSYAAELAYTLSRNARDNYQRGGGALRPDVAAVKHWETTAGGGLWAGGVGGPITGKGYHLGIIDDPVKNAEDANSPVMRAAQWDWYQSTFYTRQEPAAAIVVIQTRWHEDDLSGRILANEEAEPERWHIAHLEAIKEATPPMYAPTLHVMPDPRQPGEALAPKRYTAEKLRQIGNRIGSYYFGALYQQTPHTRGGDMFQVAKIVLVDSVSQPQRIVRYWDKAGTRDGGAYTAGVLMAWVGDVYAVLDLVMGQWEPATRERVISQTLVSDRALYGHVTTYIEQEPGSGGKESAEATIRANAGFTVLADRPVGDKVLRAEPFAAQVNIGNVVLLRGEWNQRYLDILTAFPRGAIKDPVDASSGAFSKLAKTAVALPQQIGQTSRWTRF